MRVCIKLKRDVQDNNIWTKPSLDLWGCKLGNGLKHSSEQVLEGKAACGVAINQHLHFFLGRATCGMVSMASACLLYPASLHRSSQWGFRIWAILGSGPNTKQSYKPSVDLATHDCYTSLRSSRVGASLNPESPPQASFQPAACSLRERQTPSSTSQSTERKKAGGEGRGGVAGRGFSLTNCKSRRMQQAGASDNNNMWGSCTEESQLWRHREHQGTMLVPSAGGGRLWHSGPMAIRPNIYIFKKRSIFYFIDWCERWIFSELLKETKPWPRPVSEVAVHFLCLITVSQWKNPGSLNVQI